MIAVSVALHQLRKINQLRKITATIILIGLSLFLTGCYERSVADTYSSDEDGEIKRIRERLGAITAEKEFTNEEEEFE